MPKDEALEEAIRKMSSECTAKLVKLGLPPSCKVIWHHQRSNTSREVDEHLEDRIQAALKGTVDFWIRDAK